MLTERNSNTEAGISGNVVPVTPHRPSQVAELRARLLDWFRREQRRLPWRGARDSYAIWVSEIMLQQTRVAAVIDRYQAFLDRFPTVFALASAAEADVLAQWSGLGYYRRARMLHRAAQLVLAEHQGQLPSTAVRLLTLPGIGKYTAAAIASIAHDEPIAAIDGNVERVLQRLRGWGSDDPAAQSALAHQIAAEARRLLEPAAPGDWNQAMMELGATLCLPCAPRCPECPLVAFCATRGEHPTPKRAPMRSQSAAYALVLRSRGIKQQILLVQRDASETVMPAMWELPQYTPPRAVENLPDQPLLQLRHAIMQVNYRVEVFDVAADSLPRDNRRHRWADAAAAACLPLTGLARKALTRVGFLHTLPKNSFQ
uniref:Adenine DNA glycosylase n=1 Tax=mine drainage metagenome TaxID=410659 RepID=E6QL96_9ZZZZ